LLELVRGGLRSVAIDVGVGLRRFLPVLLQE